jgi:glycosyltransferase involved in cell wall biosynthesis
MGEYARALALATALSHRRPHVDIRFAVSREAPYAADTPFPTTFLPSSPTFHSAQMCELIRAFRPTLVVFDNAGRTAQLRAAVRSGARVIFVSSRPRQRRKAFRLRWMRLLEEHWIAYPEFIAGAPRILERLKLRWLGRPSVRYLDALLPLPDAELAARAMAELSITPGHYVLVVPGGGTDHPGAARAPQIVAQAALQMATRGVVTVLVGVTPAAAAAQLRVAPRMPMARLAELMRAARLIVSNGGDTLLQALACGRPCIAVPIAGDQAHRIGKCERAGLAVGVALDPDSIADAVIERLESGSHRHASAAPGSGRATVANDMETALRIIERLAAPR